MQAPVSSPGFSTYTPPSYDSANRRSSGYGLKAGEEKAEEADSYLRKKIVKETKGGLPGFMKDNNNGNGTEYTPVDLLNIKREDSQPDLRTTCPNVLRKF